MFLHYSQILLVFAATVLSVNGFQKHCRFSMKTGERIKENLITNNETNPSVLSCQMSLCGCTLDCMVAYHSGTQRCVSAKVNPTMVAWMGTNPSAESVSDLSSVTVTRHIALEKPAAFWPLDSTSREKNYGTTGPQLDLSSTTGLDWTGVGPRGSSEKYLTLVNESTKATIKNHHDGQFKLKLESAFTVAVWIDLKSASGVDLWIPVLYGLDKEVRFVVKLTNQGLQLALSTNPTASSKSELRSGFGFTWHHVAAVFDAAEMPRFYLDAEPWAAKDIDNTVPSSKSKEFTLSGNVIKPAAVVSLACLSVYEKALTDAEIQSLMNACP